MNAYFWALIAAFIWGVVPVIEKIGLGKMDPYVGLFYRCLGVLAGIVCLVLFIIKPQQIRDVDIRSALLLVAGGFLASCAAQIAFYHALKIGEVSRITPVVGIYFVVAFFMGIIFLRETFTLPKMLGVAFMVTGLILLK